MFGHRSDGKKVKGMNVLEKAEPFFMRQRIDAVNYITAKVPCVPMDEFIARERRKGNSFTYMHILFASIVRTFYIRPKLNRFIMRGTVYQRNTLSVTMDIKPKLEEDADNITCKFYFTGRESLLDIKKIVDEEIAKYTANNVDATEQATTKTAKRMGSWPDCIFRTAMALARWADKHGMMPKKLIHASPFHTSCFITNLKSIKIGHIYHHLYDFGTTAMFFAMGKEKMEPYVENNKELKIGKFMNLGISMDERIADGFYYGKSLKLLQDFLANPDSLMESLPEDGTIPKKVIKKKAKQAKTASKKAKKQEKKTKKRSPLKNKEKHDKKMKKKSEVIE